MRGVISFAEIMAIATYLKVYEDGFVEKNYQNGHSFSFKLRKSGLDSTYLHFIDGKILFLSEKNEIDGRKNAIPIENSYISKIAQLGTDRILLLEGSKTLVIELMGGGNLFILKDGVIEFAMKPGKRSGKVLSVGEEYEPPKYIDLRSRDFDWETAVRTSSGDPIRTLAVRLGLSKYAEEIDCALGHVFSDNSTVLENMGKIREKVSDIYRGAEEGKIYLYKDDFFVWRSFCRPEEPDVLGVKEGLLEVYRRGEFETGSKAEAIRRNVEKMNAEMEKFRKTGEYIKGHLPEIEEILSNWKDLDQKVYEVDFEREKVSFVKEGMNIELDVNKTSGQNANDYFEMSKRIKERLAKVKLEPEEQKKQVELKKVKRVFSNYRWFINSDGNLVIAGKDAETNDSVVKKYLGEKDLYFHADIHGAPSVVMKVVNQVSEKGIEEAAKFAWCMSKAWNAKFGNGSVYYVTRSQVSKTPESGEFLARGAWIIRGKKNYVTHLELELAVGFQKYENRDYVVAAPPSSMSGRRVIIVPGEKREETVAGISEFLGVEKESIYPVLPPGTWSIRERLES